MLRGLPFDHHSGASMTRWHEPSSALVVDHSTGETLMPGETSSTNEALASASYDTARVRMHAGDKEKGSKPSIEVNEDDIAAPRLTPQGRTDPDEAGEDETDPMGGVKKGQSDTAEG
jgi:hypothetical protein